MWFSCDFLLNMLLLYTGLASMGIDFSSIDCINQTFISISPNGNEDFPDRQYQLLNFISGRSCFIGVSNARYLRTFLQGSFIVFRASFWRILKWYQSKTDFNDINRGGINHE